MFDSERAAFRGFQVVGEQMGSPITEEIYLGFLGQTVSRVHGKIRQLFGKDFDAEALVRRSHEEMERSFEADGVPLKPFLIPVLKELKQRGFRCVVATSTYRERALRILKMAGVLQWFDGGVFGDEVERGKPDPEIFTKLAKREGVFPKRLSFSKILKWES